MKVNELIARLSELPPDAEFRIHFTEPHDEDGEEFEERAGGVEYRAESDRVIIY